MEHFDVIVIGAGPAGASAALYIARGGYDVCVIHNGASALDKARIQNYYGGETDGAALYLRGIEQLMNVGAKVRRGEVSACAFDGAFRVTVGGETITSRKLVIATGAVRAKPGIPGIAELEGRGVSYCAVCDAFFYRRKRVAVLGAGEFARHELDVLSPLAAEAGLLTDGEQPCFAAEKVDTRRISRLVGGEKLTGVEFDDGTTFDIDGLFVAKGVLGAYSLAKTLGAFTDGTGIKTDENKRTNVPGLYAVGDCTAGIKQVARAVCDGMTAGLAIINELRNKQ